MPNSFQTKKVAIVHDWLVGGGAEKVVLALHELWPDAPIYTSYCSPEWRVKLDNKVITGYLQHWPFSRLRKYLAVLRLNWFEHLDLRNYDLVISSSGNGEAKTVKRLKHGALHICYCHTPTHFYWDKYDQYVAQPGFGLLDPLARLGLKLLVKPLRQSDWRAAQRPTYLIANSSHIKSMIKQYYGREAVVIHPPVDTLRFKPTGPTQRHGFVTIGRQTPYKHTDLIIQACNQLQLELRVIGDGPAHQTLRRLSGRTIKLIRHASDQLIVQSLLSAEAFIFAAYEDFGIAPVEAMAAGTPVIAYKGGGALDYVNPKTGLFFEQPTVASIVQALKQFQPQAFQATDLIAQADRFREAVFKQKMTDFLTTIAK